MKDVLTLNEVYWLNEVGQDLNEWLVEREDGTVDDEGKTLKIKAVLLTVVDADDKPFGTFTAYSTGESLKFEPDFVPELVGE